VWAEEKSSSSRSGKPTRPSSARHRNPRGRVAGLRSGADRRRPRERRPIDTTLGETEPSWPLVDSSFYPDEGELDAVEQDVVTPWTGSSTNIFRARLNRTSVTV
jgi:hypothetical protein